MKHHFHHFIMLPLLVCSLFLISACQAKSAFDEHDLYDFFIDLNYSVHADTEDEESINTFLEHADCPQCYVTHCQKYLSEDNDMVVIVTLNSDRALELFNENIGLSSHLLLIPDFSYRIYFNVIVMSNTEDTYTLIDTHFAND